MKHFNFHFFTMSAAILLASASCGTGSGWRYKVNGEYPDVGASKYVLSDGDTVEWVYTCDAEGGK